MYTKDKGELHAVYCHTLLHAHTLVLMVTHVYTMHTKYTVEFINTYYLQ